MQTTPQGYCSVTEGVGGCCSGQVSKLLLASLYGRADPTNVLGKIVWALSNTAEETLRSLTRQHKRCCLPTKTKLMVEGDSVQAIGRERFMRLSCVE